MRNYEVRHPSKLVKNKIYIVNTVKASKNNHLDYATSYILGVETLKATSCYIFSNGKLSEEHEKATLIGKGIILREVRKFKKNGYECKYCNIEIIDLTMDELFELAESKNKKSEKYWRQMERIANS